MVFKLPKNTDKFIWTNHSIRKMLQYNLSETRIKRVINNPQRKELGIAPKTIAVMQPNNSKHNYEIWAMYQIVQKSKFRNQNSKISDTGKRFKIITAWKYPGKSPIRGPIPIPLEILEELGEIIKEK